MRNLEFNISFTAEHRTLDEYLYSCLSSSVFRPLRSSKKEESLCVPPLQKLIWGRVGILANKTNSEHLCG